ncbi:MAG: hypothetical protein LBM02_10115 [Lachnospiraceae bacterium]|jgi:hypothetical protein|nr:hypothetical protein [Lachnospiraceae bacterium]
MASQKDNISVSFGVQGMERQNFQHLLDDKVFTFQRNGNMETDEENIGLTNEHSNLLCSRFKPGYIVIGTKYDNLNSRVYFFLTEKEVDSNGKRKSEIGSIRFNKNIQNIDDVEVDCGCDMNSILSKPLEETAQNEYCTYETIIGDDCNNCLNFDPNHPIFDVVLKQETCGYTMTFTDGYNPPRYIILNDLEPYKHKGSISCGIDNSEPTCLDCDKLRIFPLYTIPCLQPVVIQHGGRLKRGTYEFAIAYCDKLGNEMTQYYSLTNPISIFDKNNNILDQPNLTDVTNFGIRLSITQLDTRFNYYKIVVIENANINGVIEPYVEGIHNINDTTIVYTSNINKQRTTLEHIFAIKPTYKTWGGLVAANDYLIGYDYTIEKEWNLQPIVNLLGSFVKWQTVQASEDLYADGVNDSLYGSYMRDEVYPLGIRFSTNEGYQTATFPFITRPATEEELQIVTNGSNKDVSSINAGMGNCNTTDRKHKWQYYNTASVIGKSVLNGGSVNGVETVQDIQKSCIIKEVGKAEGGEIDISLSENFSSLKSWVQKHGSDICKSDSKYYNEKLCEYLSNRYEDETCNGETAFPFPISKDTATVNTCTVPTLKSIDILINNVIDEKQDAVEKELSEYEKSPSPKDCDNYKSGEDTDNRTYYIYNKLKVKDTYQRETGGINNTECNQAESIPASGIFLDAQFSENKQDLLLTKPAKGNNSDFNDFLHLGARFYKYKIDEKVTDDIIIEVSPASTKNLSDNFTGNGNMRYTIYNSCSDDTIIDSNIFDTKSGIFIRIARSKVKGSTFYLVLDVPIESKEIVLAGDINNTSTSQFIKGYATTPPQGCVDLVLRSIEYSHVKVTYSGIVFDKRMSYESKCTFLIPDMNGCEPTPYEYGNFGYYESEVEYPDNADLYNSSNIKISPDDLIKIDDSLVKEFEDYYVENTNNGYYNWKLGSDGNSVLDYRCKPIRHFKFPDNRISPFMNNISEVQKFGDNIIYPIGITLDIDVINSFLDIAVKNNILTQEQRNSIDSFEIFRGDRSIHKSIIMKGIANDMYVDTFDSKGNQKTLFRNFPYNTLGANAYLSTSKDRKTLINHPFDSEKNNRFSFIAPEIYYNRPVPPTEVSIEGYMYGNSVGGFKPVKGHSEWVILGQAAYDMANNLATLEVTFESIMNISNAVINSAHDWYTGISGTQLGGHDQGKITPLSNSKKWASLAASGAIAVINTLSSLFFKHVKYRQQWLQIFEDLGNSHNFAEMFISSKGWYNGFEANLEEGNMLRGVITSKYLKPGVPMFSEKNENIRVNNRDREDSLYISFGNDYHVEYPYRYMSYDNYDIAKDSSSRYISSETGCNNQTTEIRNIASPYFSLKNYISDQYGTIDSIKWLSVNNCGKLDKTIDCNRLIFGGDIKISRVDLKNKTPLFTVNAIDIANRVPFDYDRYSNMGVATYYCSYKSKDKTTGVLQVPYLFTEYNFDCQEDADEFYMKPPDKLYLYAYGVPYFLVESEINSNYRYAGKEPHEQFASNGVNVEDWVQEKNVSIAFNNIFYYNQSYSKQQTGLPYRTLTSVYDKIKWDCLAESPNGVVYSQQDNSEVSLSDPWLVFKPFDIYQFKTGYGKLVHLKNIESQQVLARFQDNMSMFNAVDVLRDRITPNNAEIGLGGMFAQRPIQFSYTELGETGTQHRSMVSCEFGHFWVDAKRGKVFQLQSNGQGLSVISDFKQNGESGMRKWFKRHLPFKILRGDKISGLDESKLDNPFKGLGILMWWDSKFKRVFITKRDYIPLKDNITYSGGDFIHDGNKISLQDSYYFKDVSWTVAYSPIYLNWVSYYDFKPDYAIAYNDYFQTGLNYSKDDSELGLWTHLLTNKSYQVFYGKKYPWEIELPIKNTYTNNILQDIQTWTISKRYHNEYDYAVWRKKSFNKAIIYNQTNNSGLLHLKYVDGYKKSEYPKTISSIEQQIATTHFDEQLRFNYFYNRVKKEESHLPVWNWDYNEINKTLNSNAISFNSKKVLERIRGDWFVVRYIQDNNTQFKHYFKWQMSTEQSYR